MSRLAVLLGAVALAAPPSAAASVTITDEWDAQFDAQTKACTDTCETHKTNVPTQHGTGPFTFAKSFNQPSSSSKDSRSTHASDNARFRSSLTVGANSLVFTASADASASVSAQGSPTFGTSDSSGEVKDVGFHTTTPLHYEITASGSGSNSFADAAFGGGAVSPFTMTNGQQNGPTSGTLPPGDYSTRASFDLHLRTDVGPPSGSATLRYTLTLGPACASAGAGGGFDSDGDGLCDAWERDGIDSDDDGHLDYRLSGASPTHKDVYVEIDYMTGHKPDPEAIADVVESFASAPVSNPDGAIGIRLHVITDEELPHSEAITLGGRGPADVDFDVLKQDHFGTAAERAGDPEATLAKRLAYRYNIWAHGLEKGKGSSGVGETPGNDFIVSLGRFRAIPPGAHPRGTESQQAATFMHELGHTLGLQHGGGDEVNCKPNYLSVMNYAFQFDSDPVPGRPLDYSNAALSTLDESALSEPAGIGGPLRAKTAFGPSELVVRADRAIDWNQDNDFVDTVASNVNDDPNGGCDGTGSTLDGYADWPHLLYNFRGSPSFASGKHPTADDEPEMTYAQAAARSRDRDRDGFKDFEDDCPTARNPSQTDANHDGVGDVCVRPKPARLAGTPATIRVDGKRRFRFRFRATPDLKGRALFRSIKKHRTLVRKAFGVPRSGRVVLRARLSKRSFRTLNRNRRIKARVTITLRNPAGVKTSASRRVTFKRR